VGVGTVLILAATPIGNTEDASPRLQRMLREARHIFAEDTRHAAKLLARLGIDRPTSAFHDHSERSVLDRIGRLLEAGDTLLYISDAGMPGINDPGFELVRLARALDVAVDVIPGPCAPVNALVLSGLPCHEFCFLGFFPTTTVKRVQMIDRLRGLAMTAVFFEGPSRIAHSLAFLAEHVPEAEIAVCREMTKLHQEVLRGTPAHVIEALEMIKGELCLVIGPLEEDVVEVDPRERYARLIERGEKPSRAVKIVAAELGLPKREAYARIHGTEEDET